MTRRLMVRHTIKLLCLLSIDQHVLVVQVAHSVRVICYINVLSGHTINHLASIV